MIQVRAGDTVAHTFTVSGSGALSDETFTAFMVAPNGARMSASAAIADASARTVTATVAASEWPRHQGGYGALELRMLDGGVASSAGYKRVKVLPGLSDPPAFGDYS